jgi:plastocyanin
VLGLAAFAAISVAAGGCGDSSQGAPADSASSAMSALASGDGEEACKHLTPEAQQEVMLRAPALLRVSPGTTCPQLVTAAAYLVKPYKSRMEEPSFLNIQEDGNAASLTFVGASFPIQLEKRGDKWLISASTIQSAAAQSATAPR